MTECKQGITASGDMLLARAFAYACVSGLPGDAIVICR